MRFHTKEAKQASSAQPSQALVEVPMQTSSGEWILGIEFAPVRKEDITEVDRLRAGKQDFTVGM